MTQTYDKIDHWYGWNGGECPVSAKTKIEVMLAGGSRHIRSAAEFPFWGRRYTDNDIIAFRIISLAPSTVKREVALYRNDRQSLFMVGDGDPFNPDWVKASESITIEFTLLPGESAE